MNGNETNDQRTLDALEAELKAPEYREAHPQVTSALTEPGDEVSSNDQHTSTVHLDEDGHIVFDSKDISEVAGRVDKHVLELILQHAEQVKAEEKAAEDHRANKRNQNRFLILGVALLGLFTIVPLIKFLGWFWLLPYSVGIAVLPDWILTGWAYIKKY